MRISDVPLTPVFAPTQELKPIADAINEIALQRGVPPLLVGAIAKNESGWNKLAVSFDGNYGRGLMQIDAAWHPFAECDVVYVAPVEYVTGYGRTGKRVDVAASVEKGAPVFDAHLSLDYAIRNVIAPALHAFAQSGEQLEWTIAAYNAGLPRAVDAANARRIPVQITDVPDYVPNILRATGVTT